MPLRLSELAAERREITIPWGEQSLVLTYRPGQVTPAMIDEADRRTGSDGIIWALVQWVSAWDLLGDDDKPLVITLEALADLPSKFIMTIFGAIVRDSRPNPPKGETSGAGS